MKVIKGEDLARLVDSMSELGKFAGRIEGRETGYAAGYRAGIERAAKVCDEATQQAVDHIAEVGFDSVVANVSKMESLHLATLIRALLDEPQKT